MSAGEEKCLEELGHVIVLAPPSRYSSGQQPLITNELFAHPLPAETLCICQQNVLILQISQSFLWTCLVVFGYRSAGFVKGGECAGTSAMQGHIVCFLLMLNLMPCKRSGRLFCERSQSEHGSLYIPILFCKRAGRVIKSVHL